MLATVDVEHAPTGGGLQYLRPASLTLQAGHLGRQRPVAGAGSMLSLNTSTCMP